MGRRRIVIVGGGITGLAAAHAAVRRARETGREVAVTILERSQRFGGNIVTQKVDDFLLDAGADSWVASKPHATALARELGLEQALLGTNEATRRYYVARGDRLHAVPEGLVLGVPTRLLPLVLSGLFSWHGKLRMALEPLVPARSFHGDDDESIADFATRRLGREASERLVAPLLGGISAGGANDVSVRAAFPQLVAMEREHGSLVRGMRAAVRTRNAQGVHGRDASAFLSLRGGVGDLVRALVERLQSEGVVLRTGAAVHGLARDLDCWTLDVDAGDRVIADSVLMAVPARVGALLFDKIDDSLARALASIPHSSTTTVFLAYRRTDIAHPLDGVGFVVAPSPARRIVAGTWVSSKWLGRAPEGHVLVRVFFGGGPGERSLGDDDDSLTMVACAELRALMGLDARPLWSRVFRFDAARPQMSLGHLATMRAVRDRLARGVPGMHIGGEGYDGAGIPDCIRQGQDHGRAMADER